MMRIARRAARRTTRKVVRSTVRTTVSVTTRATVATVRESRKPRNSDASPVPALVFITIAVIVYTYWPF